VQEEMMCSIVSPSLLHNYFDFILFFFYWINALFLGNKIFIVKLNFIISQHFSYGSLSSYEYLLILFLYLFSFFDIARSNEILSWERIGNLSFCFICNILH
jgi:hypothetical protein